MTGVFSCHCGNTGVERTPNESAHNVVPGEENSPAVPAGIGTHDLSITSPALLPTSYPGNLETGYIRAMHKRLRLSLIHI